MQDGCDAPGALSRGSRHRGAPCWTQAPLMPAGAAVDAVPTAPTRRHGRRPPGLLLGLCGQLVGAIEEICPVDGQLACMKRALTVRPSPAPLQGVPPGAAGHLSTQLRGTPGDAGATLSVQHCGALFRALGRASPALTGSNQMGLGGGRHALLAAVIVALAWWDVALLLLPGVQGCPGPDASTRPAPQVQSAGSALLGQDTQRKRELALRRPLHARPGRLGPALPMDELRVSDAASPARGVPWFAAAHPPCPPVCPRRRRTLTAEVVAG